MNYPERAPRKGLFRDIHAIYDLTETTPGLPLPTVSPARVTFDYRHVVHEEDARESVAVAIAVLGFAFGAVFSQTTEIAGDETARFLLEALLVSGLRLVVISRFTHDGLLADLVDSAQAQPELAVA